MGLKDINGLNKLIEELTHSNLQLKQEVELKNQEIFKLKNDLDHVNSFIIEEIRRHVEDVDYLNKINDENPSPIFRFSKRGRILIYCNGPGQDLLEQIDYSKNSEIQTEWDKALKTIQEDAQTIKYHEIRLDGKIYLLSIYNIKGSNYKNVYATDITHLKNTEDALRISKEKYRYVIENASDIVYNTDANGYFTYINPTAENRIGYTMEDMKNKLFIELIHPDYRLKILKNYLNQKKNNINSTYLEFPAITKSGEIIWLGQNVELILQNDQITGFSSIARVITERIKSQQQRDLLNTQLTSLINNLNSGILFENSDKKIALANDKFCEIFGISNTSEKLIDHDFETVLSELKSIFKNENDVLNGFSICIRNKKKRINEEIKLNNNKIIERDYIPLLVDNKFYGQIWQFKDVTEERSAQEELQKSEEKFRKIIENMRLGLIIVDMDERILDVNPCFTELTGFDRNELIGSTAFTTFLSSDNHNKLIAQKQVRLEGKSTAYELEITCKNNEKKWVIVSGAPIYDVNKQYIGSIGIHLDITERKKQEQLLEEAQQKAEASMHSKEMFLANMSHEIRTPMNAIIGMTELLSSAQLNPKQRSYLNSIKHSSENLLVILNDILDFSKIDAGKLEIEAQTFSFNDLIKNLLLQYEYKISEKNLYLNKEIDKNIHNYFNSDSTRLNQILTNLLSNAIKFTSEGCITLKCKLLEDKEYDQLIEISVIDTGIGIDETKQESIFDSFKQEDSTISRKYGGSGLGLAITKQLVKLFGGQIQLISQKGVGSTFKFSVRLQKVSETEFTSKTDNPQLNVRFLNAKVLLAEDNQMNQLIASSILEQYNLHITKVSNGQEALNKLSNDFYDVILMDIQMPLMSGIEATQLIRQQNNNIPIIALTANAIKGDKEKYIEAGMNDYIAKPFNKHDLISKIVKYLPESKYTTDYTDDKPSDLNETKSYSFKNLLIDPVTDKAFLNEIISLFVELAKETHSVFSYGINNEDFSSIKKQAHKLKSSIDLLEITELIPVIREIEKHDYVANKNSFKDLIVSFLKDLEGITQEMKKDFT